MQRFKIREGLGKKISISKRIEKSEMIINQLSNDLRNGYNPFENYLQPVTCYASELVNSSDNWENCLNDFILFKKSEGLEEDAIEAYNSKITKFCSYLEKKDIEKHHVSLFTYERATQFMVWLQENGCKAKKHSGNTGIFYQVFLII